MKINRKKSKINHGNVIQSAQNQNVVFVENSVLAATKYVTGDTGRVRGAATVTSQNVTVSDIKLSKQDDKCSYKKKKKNSGSNACKIR